MTHPTFCKKILALLTLCASTALIAAPPGPLDGENIPGDFGAENLRATQRNYTSFGDYTVTPGAVVEGNELDALYVAKGTDGIYIGITGNLATNGNAFMIGIDVPDRVGHTENRAEGAGFCGVDGPPWTLQEAAHEVIIDDNILIDDPTDDLWSYGASGTIFPCETDYVFAVDIFGGGINLNKYTLYDANGTPIATWDPTPENAGDVDADSFAEKSNVGGGPINDGNDVLENAGAISEGGFDNTNLDGISDINGSTALTATTGLELFLPYSQIPTDLGNLTGTETINIHVTIMDGVESNCAGDNWGVVVNQVLPPLATGGTPCDPPDIIGLRPDLTTLMSCAAVDLNGLATYSGTAEGLIDPAEYGGSELAVQQCPTPYGDQFFDDSGFERGGGSELDALYVTSDGVNLYLGLTGNLEENGNRILVWLDNDIGMDGEHILTWDGMGSPGGSGMEDDALPPLETDTATDALFDYTVAINISGAPPNSSVFVDLWDIVAQTSTYKGFAVMESGNGNLAGDGASNQWNMQVALNNLNSDGVPGCGFFEDPCWFDDVATVESAAVTATSGFEMAIPLADIGINPCDGPATVHVWANLTGGDGWRANQTLPSARDDDPFAEMVWQPENNPTDWYQDFNPLPENFYRAVAVTHVHSPAVENDCDESGTEDVCDILADPNLDLNFNGVPDLCEGGAVEAPLADDRFDVDGTIKACVDDAQCKDGETGPDPQTVCRNGACYVARQRYLSVKPNPLNSGASYTYRISLDTGTAGTAILGFSGFPTETAVNPPGPTVYQLTRIVETPHYTDWTALNGGYVSLADCEVSPGNNYNIQTISEGSDILDEGNYSAPLGLPTPNDNGDVSGGGNPGDPPNGLQGTLVDVFSQIKGFQNTNNEPKDWLDTDPATGAGEPNLIINLADALLGILAFQQNPYGGVAPMDCP